MPFRASSPMFTIRDLSKRDGVVVISSNRTLCGDKSRRKNAGKTSPAG